HLVEFAPRRIPLGLGLLHALDQGAHDAARLGFAIPCRVAVRESSGFVQQVVAHDSSSGSYSTRNGAYRKSSSSSLVNESSLPGVHQRSGRSSSFCHAVPVAPSTTVPTGSASSSSASLTTRVWAATTSSITPSMIHPPVRPTSGTRTSHTL